MVWLGLQLEKSEAHALIFKFRVAKATCSCFGALMFYMFFWACASNGPATAPAVTSPSPHPIDKPETQIQEAAPIPPKSQEAPLIWTLDSFQKPESVLIDFKTSRLWVSNIIGQPTEKDGKGTILELSLDGKLFDPKLYC